MDLYICVHKYIYIYVYTMYIHPYIQQSKGGDGYIRIYIYVYIEDVFVHNKGQSFAEFELP